MFIFPRFIAWIGPHERKMAMSANRQIVTIADCQWQGQLPFQQGDSHNVDGASPFWRSRIGLYESREFDLTSLFHYVMNGFTWATLLAERVAEDGDALIDTVEFALCLDQFRDDFTVDYNEERWKHFEVHWPLPSEPVMVFGEWRSCALAGAKVFLTVIWASACNSGDFEFATDPDCQVWPDPEEQVLDWQTGFRSRLAKFTAQWPGEALGAEYNRVATLMEREYRHYQRREAIAERPLREPESETPATQQPEVGHSADFHSALWYGQDFTFSHQQAAVVRLLWTAYENGTPDLSQETLLDKSGSSGGRLRDVFKEANGMHRAWGTMIVESRKGVFRLSEPQKKS